MARFIVAGLVAGLVGGLMVVLLAVTGGAALYGLDIYWRPPQPLDLGELQRVYETEFTVLRVDRAKTVAFGSQVRKAHGTFYIVEAAVYCPFGVRYHWSDARVEVRTFAGSGGTMRGRHFGVDEAAQRLLDAGDGRPGPNHLVRGASQHERLVFDLPDNVEQPGLVFLDANDPWNALDLPSGRIWEPHRFNLRYD
jgi:hypothetical protein